jgi:hypothetical protein
MANSARHAAVSAILRVTDNQLNEPNDLIEIRNEVGKFKDVAGSA